MRHAVPNRGKPAARKRKASPASGLANDDEYPCSIKNINPIMTYTNGGVPDETVLPMIGITKIATMALGTSPRPAAVGVYPSTRCTAQEK